MIHSRIPRFGSLLLKSYLWDFHDEESMHPRVLACLRIWYSRPTCACASRTCPWLKTSSCPQSREEGKEERTWKRRCCVRGGSIIALRRQTSVYMGHNDYYYFKTWWAHFRRLVDNERNEIGEEGQEDLCKEPAYKVRLGQWSPFSCGDEDEGFRLSGFHGVSQSLKKSHQKAQKDAGQIPYTHLQGQRDGEKSSRFFRRYIRIGSTFVGLECNRVDEYEVFSRELGRNRKTFCSPMIALGRCMLCV